uniref:Chromosome 2 open reading frame 78 n=1 Tax=Rhinolophus ferrumequinum TaxID=59479 RepID=A0A671ERV0_RHIFE
MLFLKYKNFQNPPLLGTPNSVQLSLPVVSNAASLTGSACNFSSLSAPAISSAWLLPTASGTSFQPLMGSAYLYQHSSTTMLSGVTGQSQLSTSAASYPVMETSLGLQPSSQTFRLPQTSTPKSYKNRNIQILESNPPPEFGEISMIAPVQSSNNLLALPSAPSQEQKENNTFDIKIKLSKSLDAYQIPIENQDPPLLPLEIPDIHQLLACIDPLGQGEQPGFENTDLGKNSLSLQDQGTLEKNGIESSGGLADISMVEDFHLPQLFNSLSDLDQSKDARIVVATLDTSCFSIDRYVSLF